MLKILKPLYTGKKKDIETQIKKSNRTQRTGTKMIKKKKPKAHLFVIEIINQLLDINGQTIISITINRMKM